MKNAYELPGKGKKYTNPRLIHMSPRVENMIRQNQSEADPLGSYTGKPLDLRDAPTQDSDDI